MCRTPLRKRAFVQRHFCLLLMLVLCLSCGFRKPWRSYEQQPFDSQKWKEGDAITRGTMVFDIHRKRALSGQSKEGVAELLGEPDKKRQGNSQVSNEVWLYRIEVVGETPRRFFPVSFDRNGKASSGEVSGGTISLIVDE